VATELGLGPVLEFHTRSDHQARDTLYTFDHLRRLFHVHTQDKQALEPENYVEYRALGKALRSDTQRVVLIDEVDKAPRDFPNDLLNELEQMAFSVPETGKHFAAKVRPVVIITSNSERQLPDAFLRRCVFHHLQPPDETRLRRILEERIGTADLSEALCSAAIRRYQELRSLGLEKSPATAELVSWVRVLLRAGVDAAKVASEPELHRLVGIGTLVKHPEDWLRLQRSRSRD
jgi:MoxR-like ATPase